MFRYGSSSVEWCCLAENHVINIVIGCVSVVESKFKNSSPRLIVSDVQV